MTYIDTMNKSALEFSRTATEFMQKISDQLQYLNVFGFTFVRTFRDGKRLHISSLQNWSDFYIDKKLQDNLNSMELYLPPSYVKQYSWEGLKNNTILDSLRDFGVGNTFAVLEHSKDHVDSFNFAKPANDSHIDLLNKPQFLKEFIKDFKIKAADLIDTTDKRKLISPSPGVSFDAIQHPSYVQQEKICDFLNFLEQAKFLRRKKSFNN